MPSSAMPSLWDAFLPSYIHVEAVTSICVVFSLLMIFISLSYAADTKLKIILLHKLERTNMPSRLQVFMHILIHRFLCHMHHQFLMHQSSLSLFKVPCHFSDC